MFGTIPRRAALNLLAFFTFALGMLGLAMYVSPVQALSDPVSGIRVFQFSCGTTAAKILPTSGTRSAKAMRVWNNSTTPVYLGGSDVSSSTATGWPICTDTAACEQAAFPVDSVANVYCKAGSSVTVSVMFGF